MHRVKPGTEVKKASVWKQISMFSEVFQYVKRRGNSLITIYCCSCIKTAGALKLTFILQREIEPLFGDWHTGLLLPLALHTNQLK